MTAKPRVRINGVILPWEEAQVPLLSHGLSRGSAIFEVFGTHQKGDNTYAFRMDKHLQRLDQTARLLKMKLKYTAEDIAKATSEIASKNQIGRAIIKIVAYWGEEAIIDLVLNSKLDVAIFCIPASDELSLDQSRPISACFSKWRKLHPETIPVQAKACANYLNSYLIRRDANDRGFDLGLTVGTDSFVAEGSIESVFIVKDGVLKTPSLGKILESITRDSILNIAKKEGMPVEETNLHKENVLCADEVFTCHTGIKILPIKKIEDKNLLAPGPVTEKISQIMQNVLTFQDERYSNWFQMLF